MRLPLLFFFKISKHNRSASRRYSKWEIGIYHFECFLHLCNNHFTPYSRYSIVLYSTLYPSPVSVLSQARGEVTTNEFKLLNRTPVELHFSFAISP